MSNTNFSISIEPKQTQVHRHESGSVDVMLNNELSFAHLHFATPYEAWKWANELTATLADQMKAEVQS
jgi:hypothetical protein